MKKVALLLIYILLIISFNIKVVNASIDISCDNLKIGVGSNVTVTPTGNTNSVVWFTTNPNVATVIGGKITGVSTGEVYISVSNANHESDICKIYIVDGYVPVSKIVLDKTSDTIAINETKKINATINPSNATNKTIFYASLDSSIVTVNNQGYITGKKLGTAYISLKIEEKVELYKVTVVEQINNNSNNNSNNNNNNNNSNNNTNTTIKLKGISIDSSKELSENGTARLYVTYNPSNATNKGVTWKSSDTKVVTVDSNGNLKAVAPGTATITVTSSDGNYESACKVTVNAVDKTLKGITLNKSELVLESGQEETLTITYNPSNAENKKVTWSSSNTQIVKVDDNGKITAVRAGNAQIKVVSIEGNYEAICKVTVSSKPIEAIAFDKETLEVYVGSATTLNTIATPQDSAIVDPIWTSDNEEVATVKDGVVNAIKIGNATITVSDKEGKIKASIAISVVEKPLEPLKVTIAGYDLKFDPEVKTYNLTIGNESALDITTNREADEITIGGNRDLKDGSIITITTKGKNKTTYVINIKKKGNYTLYFIAVISLLLFINIIRLLVKNKKNK